MRIEGPSNFQPPSDPEAYTTQPGDTVQLISERFKVEPEHLLRFNGMTNDVNEVLRPGLELLIPPKQAHPDAASNLDITENASVPVDDWMKNTISHSDARKDGRVNADPPLHAEAVATASASGSTIDDWLKDSFNYKHARKDGSVDSPDTSIATTPENALEIKDKDD